LAIELIASQAAQSRADSTRADELQDDEVYAEDSDPDDFVYEDHGFIKPSAAVAEAAAAAAAVTGSGKAEVAAVRSIAELRSCLCELLSGLNYSCFSALSAAQWKVMVTNVVRILYSDNHAEC
jgi:hypothetical protein